MRAILIFALASISTFGIAACGDSSSGSGSRTGFGSSSGSGGTGSGSGSSGSGGTTAVGGGSQSGDQSGAGPGAPSTGVDPGANGLPNDPNAPCNDVSNDGTNVSMQSSGSSMPTGTGGTQPLDGHYLLTQVQHYGFGSQTSTYQGTVFISSGIYQFVVNKNGTETRTTYGVAYSDPSITLTGRCGDSSTLNYTYTAPTETQIILYDATNKIAYTYTRPDAADVDGGV